MSKINNQIWFKITDTKLNKLILETFGEPFSKEVLDKISHQPMIIADLLKESSIPQASSYRRVSHLTQHGFLIPIEYVIKKEGRHAQRFDVLINKINIEIHGGETITQLNIKKKFLETSIIHKLLK